MPLNGSGWQPQHCTRFVRFFGSALRTTLVETDQGLGYLKGLGNPEGPHALACEFIGSSLADWLGLPTLDFSLIAIRRDDEIPTSDATRVAPGTAFISRREEFALTWGGDGETLGQLSNISAVSQLVVLDTWLRNCDRHAPDGQRRNLDNVMLVKEMASKRALRLLAMDFTHAFTCGAALSRRLANIENTTDARVYGLFREFCPLLDKAVVRASAEKLGTITPPDVGGILRFVPAEWELTQEIKGALTQFICDRARFLSAHIEQMIWEQINLPMEMENGI